MKHNRIHIFFLILLVFKLVLFSNDVAAQSLPKQELLFTESEELVYSKPNDALKICLHLLENSTSNTEKAKINFLIAKIYKVKGDYNNTLTHLFEADRNTEDLPTKTAIEILVTKAEILRALFLDNQSKKYLEIASNKALTIKDKKEKTYVDALIMLEKASMSFERQNYKEVLTLIQNQNNEFKNTLKDSPDLNLWFTITKGKIYSGLGDFDKGQANFNRALLLSNEKNNYAETYILSGLATIYFRKKDYNNAIPVLLKALKMAKALENLYLTEIISKQLTVNYIALNDTENYKFYNTIFFKTQTDLEKMEQASINTAYNLISHEYTNHYETERKIYTTQFYIVLSLFFIVFFICTAFWFKIHSKKKRLQEIINYLEITRNNLINRYTEKKEVGKKIFIPQETEQALLNKLKRLESSKRFTNNDMSLALLAGQFETNTKYLSETINKHYHVNFNTYINKLRINYIVEKLKSDPDFMNYKISYLAENCGFSSHSAFATVFKSITGISPITFIELLKNEKETSNL